MTRDSVLERKVGLGEVIDLPTFNEVVKSFADLYKVGIKVFDERGDKLADIKGTNADFCGYVFTGPDGRTQCTAMVARVKDGPIAAVQNARAPLLGDGPGPQGLVTGQCFTGLRYLIQPILWEGDLMGRIVLGPFAPDDLKDVPPTLIEAAKGLELTQLRALLAKVRKAPEPTLTKVMVSFVQILEALLAAGQKAFYASQMHIEATQESNRELEAKNRRLEEMNGRLKEVDRLKSGFVATVSHELRTPLTSIIGYTEMLAQGLAGPLNPEQLEYIRTVMEKGESLLKLITSILDLSQIEAGKVSLSFAPIRLSEVIQASTSSIAPQAKKKGVSLETSIDPASPAQVTADRERLKQVLINLLGNALKFTPKGGTVKLAVSAVGPQPELNASGFRLMVSDSGVGIAPDQHARIFESFYQVDSSSTREFGGAGLGLAIVKSFVEGHGGCIRVASEIGKGAAFTAVLPLAPPAGGVQVALPAVPQADRF